MERGGPWEWGKEEPSGLKVLTKGGVLAEGKSGPWDRGREESSCRSLTEDGV